MTWEGGGWHWNYSFKLQRSRGDLESLPLVDLERVIPGPRAWQQALVGSAQWMKPSSRSPSQGYTSLGQSLSDHFSYRTWNRKTTSLVVLITTLHLQLALTDCTHSEFRFIFYCSQYTIYLNPVLTLEADPWCWLWQWDTQSKMFHQLISNMDCDNQNSVCNNLKFLTLFSLF